jgi:nitroreductase
MLAAWEMGIGSCWIGSLNRPVLREILQSPENLKILYAVALGYPAQQSKAVDYCGSFNYYLDENQTVNVPKLSLETVLIDER